jgi:hypothetical protein
MGRMVSITSRPRFNTKERTPNTHCTGGRVGRRAGLDAEAKGNILCLLGDRTPVVQSAVRHYTAWATQALSEFVLLAKYYFDRIRVDVVLLGSNAVWNFRYEDGGSMFLGNVGIYIQVRSVLLSRRPTSTIFTFVRTSNIKSRTIKGLGI